MRLPPFLTLDDDGEIRLTGHRIGLYVVIRHLMNGHSPEQIADHFPTLPVELVRDVEKFYLHHQPEVDAYVAAYRLDLERQAAEMSPGPTTDELKRRWMERGLGALP